jgi:hypothetical protein
MNLSSPVKGAPTDVSETSWYDPPLWGSTYGDFIFARFLIVVSTSAQELVHVVSTLVLA